MCSHAPGLRCPLTQTLPPYKTQLPSYHFFIQLLIITTTKQANYDTSISSCSTFALPSCSALCWPSSSPPPPPAQAASTLPLPHATTAPTRSTTAGRYVYLLAPSRFSVALTKIPAVPQRERLQLPVHVRVQCRQVKQVLPRFMRYGRTRVCVRVLLRARHELCWDCLE